MIDKKQLSEEDIFTKFITPALLRAGWDLQFGILQEVSFTDGRIFVKGKLTARGERKRADYILYHKANPIALIVEEQGVLVSALQEAVHRRLTCLTSSAMWTMTSRP